MHYPRDSRSYNRCRERLIRLARKFDIKLRQGYARFRPKALRKERTSAHARQFKRAKREIKRLKTYLGRVYRDILCKILLDPDLHGEFHEELLEYRANASAAEA